MLHYKGSFPLALLSLCALVPGQERSLAITNARIVTMEGAPIERGTLVVRGGKITAVGADVAVPAGAVVVDAQGGTLMPGMVAAWSRAGIEQRQQGPRPQQGQGRRGGGRGQMPIPSGNPGRGAQNQAAQKVADRLDPNQAVFAELLRAGATTVALVPQGQGLPGIGAVLRPDGKTSGELVQNNDAFLLVSMARDTAVKKILKEAFAAAKKVVEERKKPKAEPAPAPAAQPPAQPAKGPEPGKDQPKGTEPPKPDPKPDPPKPEPKPGEQGAEKKPATPEPEKRPEPKKDPNVEALADLLEGKRRALLEIGSAADLLHWFNACGDDLAFPRTLIVTQHDTVAGSMDTVVEQVQKLKAPVLMSLNLTTQPRTRYLVNPARVLHDAGVETGFLIGDSKEELRQVFYQLMEQVRAGLPVDVALKGVTLVPAKALGVDQEVGSLKAGKRADLLLWTGDPLDPASRLRTVWLAGQEVAQTKKGAER